MDTPAPKAERPRHVFYEMEPQKLGEAIEGVGLDVNGFAHIAGARCAGDLWEMLRGRRQIPPFYPVLLALLALPGAVGRARAVAQEWTELYEKRNPHR